MNAIRGGILLFAKYLNTVLNKFSRTCYQASIASINQSAMAGFLLAPLAELTCLLVVATNRAASVHSWQMPLYRSRNVLLVVGVIFGWITFSVFSNWKQVRFLYCQNAPDMDTSEVICRAMRCRYPHYFFVPFSKFWEDKSIGYQPRSWCIKSVLDDLN